MYAFLLALSLSASPTLQQARAHAAAKAWEELYFDWSAVKVDAVPAPDRPPLAGLMLDGARALAPTDAVMAWSLAELSCKLHPTPGGLLQLARLARATQQATAAEEALRKGVEQFPGDAELLLELGTQLVQEQDHKRAVTVLEKVPPKSPRAAEARALLGKAKAALKEEAAALKEADALERRLLTGTPAGTAGGTAAQAGTGAAGSTAPASLSYESSEGPGGMRVRQNARFRFRYFSAGRDFGQRADYEGHIQAAMDEAWGASQRILGAVRKAPLDVILYSREEFALHQGAAAAQTEAGHYTQGAIRMNDSAAITPKVKATLVHEYVHAVTDELVGNERLPRWFAEGVAEWVEFRYLGGDGAPLHVAARIRSAASQGALPTLEQMTDRPPIHAPDPGAAYGFCALAVRELSQRGGFPALLRLMEDVRGGTPFDEALQQRFDRTSATLDEEVRRGLGKR